MANTQTDCHPSLMSMMEGKYLEKPVTNAISFGYCFRDRDLRLFVQRYLKRKGIAIKAFKENLPESDWMRHFLKINKKFYHLDCVNIQNVVELTLMKKLKTHILIILDRKIFHNQTS